jgi:hypothetical protein
MILLAAPSSSWPFQQVGKRSRRMELRAGSSGRLSEERSMGSSALDKYSRWQHLEALSVSL